MGRKGGRWIGLTVIGAAVIGWWRSRRRSGDDRPDYPTLESVPALKPEPEPEPESEPLPEANSEPEPAPIPEPSPESESGSGSGDGPVAGRTWVDPIDGECPEGYPIKVNERSGIYHVPEGLSYGRTNPTRCYPNEEAAEVDGFRKAKR